MIYDDNDTVKVRVDGVTIPPMSTVETGYGARLDDGARVSFFGDHRPMYAIGLAISDAVSEDDLPIADVPAWMLR